MSEKLSPQSCVTRSYRAALFTATVVVGISTCSVVAYAVRANWGVRMEGPRLEKASRYEDAALYYRGGLDFYAVIYQLWIESAVYDERADEIYRKGATIFGQNEWRGADHEERWDTIGAYILFFNREGAARSVEKGKFSPSRRGRLEDRVRIYMEDLIDPDHGFGGDFSFARKARILESVGLFRHASYRRELAGRYAIRVCSRYYAAVADELERSFGDPARASVYRERAAYWRSRGVDELRLCNGDRALAQIKGGKPDARLDAAAMRDVLRKGLASADADTRLAAERVLNEGFGKPPARAGRDGLSPGIVVEYFDNPQGARPAARKVFETVDMGMKFQANFPKVWYDLWKKPEIFPPGAKGPFRLRMTAKLYVPADGDYRFYVKNDAENRATVTVETAGGVRKEIISPRNDGKLQYVAQVGMRTHRIDFSEPVRLTKGLRELVIVYTGDEVRKIHNEHMVRISGVQNAGIQLFWSSDRHPTELVPAANLFH